MTKLNDYISVGKILNFHGLQGEAKVGFSKNQTEFLSKLKEAYICCEDKYDLFKITCVRFNNKNAIIKFEGIDNINDIVAYKNCLIFVKKNEFEKFLKDDEFLVNDLVGTDVYSAEKKVGVVVGVTTNGASDLLSVRTLSKNISMIPFVKELVPEVDLVNKKIFINEIPGLVE